jgi:hypothetical protein
MNLKKFLEEIVTTASFQPSNYVGTRMPDGGFAKPGMGPQKQKGKSRLKKKAKVNSIEDMTMDMQKRPTMFKISPAEWETSETPTNKNAKASLK